MFIFAGGSYIFGLRTLVGTGSRSTAFKELPAGVSCIKKKFKSGQIYMKKFGIG